MAEKSLDSALYTRLRQGDVVYLAEGENHLFPQSGDPITKKASVWAEPVSYGTGLAGIQRWEDPETPPIGTTAITGCHPYELFTESEVAAEVLARPEAASHLGEMTLGGILRDPHASEELAQLLQEATRARAPETQQTA